MALDPTSLAGRFDPPAERYDMAVVGAGPAGCAAALAAAREGASVLLVDEHPVAPGLIGLDVPYRFGARATAAVQRPERITEQMLAAQPLLAEAFDAGVEVRLGVCAWGAWAAGGSLPARVLGLADETRAWFVGFETLIVAAGARDLAIGLHGADLPGVVGAQGLHALLVRYDAFAGRQIVIVGGGPLADATAELAAGRGLQVVERLADPDAWTPLRASGGADGVETLVVADAQGRERAIACDTVCLAVGLVPQVDLPAVLGCALTFEARRGGWMPVLDERGAASLPFVRVVGDAAGVAADDRLAWMRAALARQGADVPLCLCEEVTRAEFLGVHPPRYLGAGPGGQAPLEALGGPHPDHLKRLTRAGMGACQGRRCREQAAMLLALEGGVDLGRVPLASYRIPVRPLPMAALAAAEESAAMGTDWAIWFGIEEQWTHYTRIPVEAG